YILDIPLHLLEETINAQWEGKKAFPNIAAVREAYSAVRQFHGGKANE
ncbi:MAG: hypothetical protein GX930_05720, partial [Clostridia bacterium]|nr:hypothetical protein [Clostridia bacterium]